MIGQLITNIKINLKFYRRNRLLVLIVLFLLFVWGLMSLPSIFLITTAKKFNIITQIFSQLSGFIFVLTAILALLTLSYHVRNRCIKMVITKPCPLETWLLSSFLSAIIVCFTLYVITFIICVGLFMMWHIPIQWGLVYITLDSLLKAIIIFSYLTFLTALFHPGIAVLIAFILQEGTFYYLLLWIKAGLETVESSAVKLFLQCLEQIMYFLYMAIPTFSPFADKTVSTYRSFRIASGNVKYIFYEFIYTAVLVAFFYFLAVYFLKKKRHI